MLSKACVVGTYQRKLEELARLDIDLTVLVPPSWRAPSGTLRLERAHTTGYRLLVEPIRFNGNFHLYYFPTLARRVHEFRPDILHIDEEPYNLASWLALRIARRANVRSVLFSWQNLNRAYPFPFSFGERWALHTADALIAGTESAAEVWRQKGFRKTLAVIQQFGVDPDLFKPIARSASGDHSGYAVIGYAGRLVPEKGVDTLIEAAARLPGAWRLEIAGQGPELDALQRQARRLNIGDRVIFHGQLPSARLPAFYQRLSALVVPSRTRPNWKEQFGRVIIEAMACSVPVIGSDCGAIPDVIGDAGLIFPEGNVQALAEVLGTLLIDPAQQSAIGAAGRARTLVHFTHAQVAAQTAQVYTSLLRSHSATEHDPDQGQPDVPVGVPAGQDLGAAASASKTGRGDPL